MRLALLLISGLVLSACASTSAVKVTPVEIQPVTQIKSDPFVPKDVLELAEGLFEDEQFADALKEYSRLTAFDPNDEFAKLGSANCYLALGQYSQAASIFWDETISWDDELKLKDIEIGRTLSGIYTNRYEDVEKALNEGLVLSPEDGRIWNAKGQWHDGREEWMEALSAYVTALNTGSSRSGTINNMGMSLLLQGRFKEARDKFIQATDISSKTKIYDNNLRMSHMLLGDLELALENIDEAQGANIVNDAGYVAMKRGQFSLAERLFSKALEISPVFHVKAQSNLNRLRENLP